jgi:hypothetical protein
MLVLHILFLALGVLSCVIVCLVIADLVNSLRTRFPRARRLGKVSRE